MFPAGIEPIILQSRSAPPIATSGICRDSSADAGCGVRIENAAEMLIERRNRTSRIGYQLRVMDMQDGLLKPLLIGRSDHQSGRREPPVTVSATNIEPVDSAAEGPAQYLGEPCDRGQHRDRIAMHKDEICIGIDFA